MSWSDTLKIKSFLIQGGNALARNAAGEDGFMLAADKQNVSCSLFFIIHGILILDNLLSSKNSRAHEASELPET